MSDPHNHVDPEIEKAHLIAWARRFIGREATPITQRYIAAIQKMNHDELALVTAVFLLAGRIPLSDEES